LRHAGAFPALVLNADYRPLSAFPLSVWPWQDAVHAAFTGRVVVVREHDRVARSQRVHIRMPSIVALKEYVRINRAPAFTRHNVLLRDRYCCGYCGHSFEARALTFDHVIPRAAGGRTCWTNIIMACHACNGTKACRTPDQAKMPLQWRPWQPTIEELAAVGSRFRRENLHDGWSDYLYWDSELQA
jgi:5-methylcytosine-specific restriction endonuclease McrA